MNTDKELNDILTEDEIVPNEDMRTETDEEFSEIPDGEVVFEDSSDDITENPDEEDAKEENVSAPNITVDEEITLFSDDNNTTNENTKRAIEELIDNEMGVLPEETSDIPPSTEDEDAAEDAANKQTTDTNKDSDNKDTDSENKVNTHTSKISTAENKKHEDVKTRRIDGIFDFIELFVFTLAAVFIITSFFFQYSIVDGGSMSNTLHNQDKLILSNFMYEPECGDVVVIEDLSTDLKKPIVKRIIATGGQKVKITKYAIFVDGEKLDEPYVYTDDYQNIFGFDAVYEYSVHPSENLMDIVIDMQEGEYYEIKVPKGELFVMGDHRNASNDSRDIGTVHEDAVLGKVILRFFPFDSFGKIE